MHRFASGVTHQLDGTNSQRSDHGGLRQLMDWPPQPKRPELCSPGELLHYPSLCLLPSFNVTINEDDSHLYSNVT